MKVLELFSGTRSIGKAFEAHGHEVFSVDWDEKFDADLHCDIGNLTAQEILDRFGHPDVIWLSPDCTTFSVSAISKHRRKNKITGSLDPISDYAKRCDEIDQHCLDLIKELEPTFWFIENPRGGMRKMEWMQGLPRYTVTYCFASETEVITDRGSVKLGDVVGSTINILDGNGDFVSTLVKNYGKSKLMRITLTRRNVKKIIYATPNHKWFVVGNSNPIETKNLKPRSRLVYKSANLFKYNIVPEYVARGFVFGDGWVIENKPHAFAMFVGNKQDVIPYFNGFGGKIWDDNKNGLSIKKIYSLPRKWKTSLPDLSCSKDELYSWLIGYFSADGSISEKNKQVTISSCNRTHMEFIQNICDILGIGHYEINEFWRKGFGKDKTPIYQLTFMRSDLTSDFFIRSNHRKIFNSVNQPKHQPRRWTVESIEETSRYEDVFCCEVETTHSFVLKGGILTHNCQYGDDRMKPTDLWTNHPNPKFKPPCKNGDPCHTPAPRGAKTGTQGLANKVEKARIPQQLCEHIVDICEEYINA